MSVVYQAHPLYWHALMRLCMLKLSVGKGHQIIQQHCSRVLQYYTTVATGCVRYVLYRALVIESFWIQVNRFVPALHRYSKRIVVYSGHDFLFWH